MTGDLYKQRENNFVDCLNDLFDISHANTANTMNNKEDIAFLNLQSQKVHPGCMVGKDLILSKAEKITVARSVKTNTNLTPTTEFESDM